ncbi:MAG: hypothetical protein Q8R36_00380 [bacterium]|nr:hypothetical protein [bacterium]
MAENNEVVFYFSPFTENFENSGILLAFGFEDREDPVLTKYFPELESRRKLIDKRPVKDGVVVTLQSIARENTMRQVGLIYLQYPWRKKKEIMMGGINFLREVMCSVHLAVEKIKDEGHEKLFIMLPDIFSPRNIKDTEQKEHLYRFIKIVTEAIVYANKPYNDFKSATGSTIKEVVFMFSGESQKALDEFFKKAITNGEIMGRYAAKTRRLIETPPNLKTPISFVSDVLGKKITIRSSDSWRKIVISQHITAHLLSGTRALRLHDFELINAVNAGSEHEPCLLRLHYKPKTNRQKRIRRVILTGKGVIFDAGGYDLKGAGSYNNMHYDMSGAATVLSIPFLAQEFNIPVEIIAIVPVVQNMIGPKATLPHSIIRAYGGKTVEIVNTDAEGRLILAEAIAFGEKKFKPDAIITVGTLCDSSDFGPDFLKVGIVGAENEKRVRIAEKRSAEKVFLLPSIEYFNKVDEMHVGLKADIINDLSTSCHVAPFIFLHNFLGDKMSWIFVDNSALFEEDAKEYGVGPGFGVKFVWHLVKQFC